MKNQYFQPRTLPKPPATFPELPGSATEPSGAAQKLCGGPSSGPAPARAKSGRPQHWSRAISSIEISMKNKYVPPRTVPKHSAIFPDLSGNATELPGAAQVLSGRLSGAQAPARAESGRPQNWSPAFFCVCIYNDFWTSVTQVNLYEDVSLSSRKISAYDCLCLSFVGDVSFLRITGQAHVPRELMTQLPNHLVNKWQTAKRGGGIAALLRFG